MRDRDGSARSPPPGRLLGIPVLRRDSQARHAEHSAPFLAGLDEGPAGVPAGQFKIFLRAGGAGRRNGEGAAAPTVETVVPAVYAFASSTGKRQRASGG